MRTLHKILIAAALILSTVATGCRAQECQQMQRCCQALADLEGVGQSCDELAKQTKDPTTCRAVLRTLTYLVEDSGQDELPEQCR